MCGTDTRRDLKLTPTADSACACCSTGSSPTVPARTAGTGYGLQGLTCGHCVKTVELAVSAAPGAELASVELVAGGISSLIATGSAAPESVLAAVEIAGYSIMNS